MFKTIFDSIIFETAEAAGVEVFCTVPFSLGTSGVRPVCEGNLSTRRRSYNEMSAGATNTLFFSGDESAFF